MSPLDIHRRSRRRFRGRSGSEVVFGRQLDAPAADSTGELEGNAPRGAPSCYAPPTSQSPPVTRASGLGRRRPRRIGPPCTSQYPSRWKLLKAVGKAVGMLEPGFQSWRTHTWTGVHRVRVHTVGISTDSRPTVSMFLTPVSIHPPHLFNFYILIMRPLVRRIFSSVRNSLRRTMSSLAPGHLLQGAHWDYRIVHAVKGDNTHSSAVFKANVVPRENVHNAPQWFVCITSTASKF